jgi:hypothetical protein
VARHQPTAQQKAAAAERRARFTELAQRVAEMSDERAALVALMLMAASKGFAVAILFE